MSVLNLELKDYKRDSTDQQTEFRSQIRKKHSNDEQNNFFNF